MSRITRQEKLVADRLRREIGQSRPEFSEELHARLRQALRQEQANKLSQPAARPAAGRLSRWASVLAAICLLAAVCAAWQAMHVARDVGPNAPTLATDRKPSLGSMSELAHRAVAKTDAMVSAAVKADRWAGLDQDVRSVLKMPVARLPFDVVSSLLSVKRPKDSRHPSPGPASPRERDHLPEHVGVRDG
jgi:hypothetical protein